MRLPLGTALLLRYDNTHLIFHISDFPEQTGIGPGFTVMDTKQAQVASSVGLKADIPKWLCNP